MGWLDSDGWFLHSKWCWLGLQLHGSLDGLVYSSLLTHMTDSWWWPSPGRSGGLSAGAPTCGPSTPRLLGLLTAWQLSSYRENPNNECFKTKKSETSSPLKNLTHLCYWSKQSQASSYSRRVKESTPLLIREWYTGQWRSWWVAMLQQDKHYIPLNLPSVSLSFKRTLTGSRFRSPK